MIAEVLSDRVTNAICSRIEADFGEDLGISTSLDKLSLEECSQFISIAKKSPAKWNVFATINVSCRRSGVGKYEVVVQVEMDQGGLTGDELVRSRSRRAS